MTTLKEVHDKFKEHLKMDNTKEMLLDAALAVHLSQQMTGTPLWLLFVGPSGDGKSEIVMSLDNKENTMQIHELTSKTLVSGFEKTVEVEDDGEE